MKPTLIDEASGGPAPTVARLQLDTHVLMCIPIILFFCVLTNVGTAQLVCV